LVNDRSRVAWGQAFNIDIYLRRQTKRAVMHGLMLVSEKSFRTIPNSLIPELFNVNFKCLT